MKKGMKILLVLGVILTAIIILGQSLALINYDLTVYLGLQESEKEVGKVGIAFAKGFALGDTIIYLPLLILGIIGLKKQKKWGLYSMISALGITIYWPIVNLYAFMIEKQAITLSPEKYYLYPIILSLITIYGIGGIYYLYKNEKIK